MYCKTDKERIANFTIRQEPIDQATKIMTETTLVGLPTVLIPVLIERIAPAADNSACRIFFLR